MPHKPFIAHTGKNLLKKKTQIFDLANIVCPSEILFSMITADRQMTIVGVETMGPNFLNMNI